MVSVALHWLLPWGKANQPHAIVLALVNEDGEPFLDVNRTPVRIEGQVEVGRPPGVKHGSYLEAPLALKFPGIAFDPGGYRFEFYVNGSLEAIVAFTAVGGPT